MPLHRPVDGDDKGDKARGDTSNDDGEEEDPPDGVSLAPRPVGRWSVSEGALRAHHAVRRRAVCDDERSTYSPPIRTRPVSHSVHAPPDLQATHQTVVSSHPTQTCLSSKNLVSHRSH